MCGIYLSCEGFQNRHPPPDVVSELKCRGPDDLQTKELLPSQNGLSCYLNIVSSVLSLRGESIVNQPVVDDSDASDCFLLWNGEAWKYNQTPLNGSDTRFIFDCLLGAAKNTWLSKAPETAATQAIVSVLSKIYGPFAFVFYDAFHQSLYYGRDILGRRSLLIHSPSVDSIELSSIAGEVQSDRFVEVKSDGIYMVDLASGGKAQKDTSASVTQMTPQRIPWKISTDTCNQDVTLRSPFPPFNKTIGPNSVKEDTDTRCFDELLARLKEAVSVRVHSAPINRQGQQPQNRIGILFSGGLDCTLLARIAHNILPFEEDIDLLNVAFENPRVLRAITQQRSVTSPSSSAYEACPDRISARQSHKDLMELCHERIWRLVCIDVPYEELCDHRPKIIALLWPSKTEMDFSIGCALYFAARGTGNASNAISGHIERYQSPARVLLSGLGADELFGGYSRHSAAFARGGLSALVGELELDFKRIGERNLGRDDRVISHWGKEVRYPFLDEEVVIWALGAPVWQKCGFGRDMEEDGPDDPCKWILRVIAWGLGLTKVANLKKRAIQFGARTAKMEVGNTKGHTEITM